MYRLFVLLCALCTSLLPGASSADTLKRLTLRQDLLGFEAVGRLDLGDSGYCTGVLVATDLVLTAAHCLWSKDGKRLDPAKAVFHAGLRDGEAIAVRRGARAVIHPRYHPADRDRQRQLSHDVALVQLASPIPAATAAPFLAAPLARGARSVTAVTYARGRSNALSAERRCTLLDRGGGLMVFDCDVDFGSSGAPVFAKGQRRYRIVSLMAAKADTARGVEAIGMELAPRLAELHTALRSGKGVYPVAEVTARRLQPGMRSSAGGAKFVRP